MKIEVKLLKRAISLLLAAAYFSLTSTVNAATFYVTDTSDVVSTNGSCTLREAVEASNNAPLLCNDCGCGDGYTDEIQLTPGSTYELTSGLQLNGFYVAIRGGAFNKAIIKKSASVTNSSGLTANPGAVLILDDVSLQGFTYTALTIKSNATVYAYDLEVTGNFSSIVQAGAVDLLEDAYFTCDHCDIYNNRSIKGGGIKIWYNADAFISDSSITDNIATQYGGGVHVYGGFLSCRDSLISFNQAKYSGGGIYTYPDSSSSLYMDNCAVTNNSVTQYNGTCPDYCP